METPMGLIVGASNKTAVAALRNPAIKCLWLCGPSDVGKSYLANLLSPGAVILDTVNPAEDRAALLDKHWDAGERVVMIAPLRPRDVISNPRQLTRIMRGAICALEPWTDEMRAEYFTMLTPGADKVARETLLECVDGGPRVLSGLATAWRVSRFGAEPDQLASLAAAYGRASFAKASRVDMEGVLQVVCERYNISTRDVLGQRRTKNAAFPRHVVCYLAKEMTGRTLTEIGKFMGGRDHSTILSAVNKIKAKLTKDMGLGAEVARLRRRLETEHQ